MQSEFQIGEAVIHRREGLSFIDSIVTISDNQYFLVRSKRQSNETFYVPIERAEGIIRKVMSEKDADQVLRYMKSVDNEYNSVTKQRRDAYKKRLSSGETLDFAYLTAQLFHHDKLLGTKDEIHLGPVDFDLLNKAKELLFDEFSITYKVEMDKMDDFIKNRMKKLK